MALAFRLSFFFLALSFNLDSLSPQAPQQAHSIPVAKQSDDEASVRALAETFFRAWGAKDLDGFMRLWSPGSPGLESRKQRMQKLFADYDPIEVKSPTIRSLTLNGDKARLRIDVEINAVDVKTGKPAAELGQLRRVMDCARENGVWRVAREESAFEDLAKALVAAATEKDRDALLAGEGDMLAPELTRALNDMGVRFASQGLYPKAIDVFRIAQNAAENINDLNGLAVAVGAIGLINFFQDDYEPALESLQKSLRLGEAIGDQGVISRAWNNLGLVYQAQGNFSLAIESYMKCLEIAQIQQDKRLIPMALGNIGNVFNSQGNYREASEYYQRSQVYYRESGSVAGEGRILHSLGNIQYYQGNFDLALKFYKESLALKKTAGNVVEQSRTLNALGVLSALQGDYKSAEDFHRESLEINEASKVKGEIALSLRQLGNMYLAKGDLNSAFESLNKSLEINEATGDKKEEGDTLNDLAKLYLLQGKPAQALEAGERATEIAKQIGGLEMLWTALTHTGKAHSQLARPVQARQSFEEAIAAIETLRRLMAGGVQEARRYLENKLAPYHELVRLLVDQGRPGEALAYAEQAKARALLDVLQHGRAGIQKAMTGAEQEQERRLTSELITLNVRLTRAMQVDKPDPQRVSEIKSRLENARLNCEAFQTSLYNAHPELKVQRGEASIIKTGELAGLLPNASSALLEYIVTDDMTYLFAVTKAAGKAKAEVGVYTLPIKRDELVRQTEAFRRQLSVRDLGFRASAAKLYELLLKPAEAQLRGKTNLIIAPDGKLWDLPFQALERSPNRFLIEDVATTYAPSLTALREMTRRRKEQGPNSAPATLLALGNPQLGWESLNRPALALRDEKLDSLPEAEQEVKGLSRFYRASRSSVYVGAEAREDRVKNEAGQVTILHFATHGILNDASPMYSYLGLARGAAEEDGLLEAWELMRLDLKADLAVLSACETARGRFGAGEGMIGLTWALFVAGVPSTVVSQWKVESASTRDLMLGFHGRLRAPASMKTKMAKAEALRQAALKMLKNPETRHPFYWAGFVLIGAG